MAQTVQVERSSDRWAAIVLSVLLHGVLLAAVVYGWWSYKHDRPAPTLAIEATVVDSKSVPGLAKQLPQPAPPTPPPPAPEPQPAEKSPVESDGPPQPTPEELAKREQEQKEQAEREVQAKQQEEDRKRAEQERQQEAALAEEKRLADEQQKKAQEKAEAERKAREAVEAKKRAEEKRLEEEKKVEQQANAQREADLRQSLDQELRQDAARSSGALASWQSQITARIQRAWLKPPSARPGIECVLYVTQVPGGEVTNVRIGTCNGDQAVRESIEAAVYRASPLPPPPDPTLFERSLVITFRPD